MENPQIKWNMKAVLTAVLAVVFAVGLFMMIRQMTAYGQGDQSSQNALDTVLSGGTTAPSTTAPQTTQPESTGPEDTAPPETTEPYYSAAPLDEAAQYLQQMNIPALQEVNGDVQGWIYIPDTKITYPLLQGKDNQQYLHTTWEGKKVYSGSIYLDSNVNTDLKDFHTIIYGHNMANGSMFGNLIGYAKQKFYEEHRYVYIVTNTEIYRYEIFSAHQAAINSSTYWVGPFSQAHRQQAINDYISQSALSSDVIPTAEDRILTLSTCTGSGDYDYRWVVHAVLTDIWQR
jgi:sortase B